MERNTINGFYSWILLVAVVCWIVRCGKLDGYSFPVYATSSCPRNQTEWKNRSTVLNCTDSNGYICIPNENITKLLEFCYRYPRIPINKGICLFLRRSTSLVEAYSCNHFRNGCPKQQYWSYEIFIYPACLSIGYGCFLAEQFCDEQRITTFGSVEITNTQDDLGRTTLNTSLQNSFTTGNSHDNNTWVPILVLGVFLLILFTFVCLPVMIFIIRRMKTLDERPPFRDLKLDPYSVPLLSSTNTTHFATENAVRERHTNNIKRDNNEEEISLEKSIEELLRDCLAEENDNTLCLDETCKKSDISWENDSEEKYFTSDEDVSNWMIENSSHLKENKRINLEEHTSDDVQDETVSDFLKSEGPFSAEVLPNLSKQSVERSQGYREGKYDRYFSKSPHSLHWKQTHGQGLTKLISKLGKDLLLHSIIDDKRLHSTISARLKIPEEVLLWNYDARKRYLEYLKKRKTPIFRSRAMIVGCASAGKTTLVERLKRKSMEEIKAIKSTVGLDVHNDIFEVQEKGSKLQVAMHKCESSINIKENVPHQSREEIEKKKLLSILDFGGQCMYYACHQIYLSKRAFYILVVDMSKDLKKVIDEELCDQRDTMFSGWSYKDYLLFWLKSVDCYCGREAPVIFVATHAEGKTEEEKIEYYEEIINTFPQSSTIKEHLSCKRYFTISLPRNDKLSLESLDELERCIVDVAKSQKQWGEEVPKDWAKFEEFILEKKETKLQRLSKLKESFDELLPLAKQEFADLLRFYHDVGLILYFSFKDPESTDYYLESDIAILNIQWFVDSFKYVVTDLKQEGVRVVLDAAPTTGDLNTFKTTGRISGTFLTAIWKATDNRTAAEYKNDMIKYMERLGLIAIEDTDMYFIPSMNRMKMPDKVKSKIHKCYNKSPTLYFRFPVLPFFVFYRLIVLCLRRWEPLMDGRKCIYIDTAMFTFKENVLVLGVSESYIQLMLYRNDWKPVEKTAFRDVIKTVKEMLSSLINTFHSDLEFEVGYSCTPTEFSKELGETFIKESIMLNHYGNSCPLHAHADDHDAEYLTKLLDYGKRLKRLDMIEESEISPAPSLGLRSLPEIEDSEDC